MHAVFEQCKKRGVATVILHASPQGRPLYESVGFCLSDEMMISLGS